MYHIWGPLFFGKLPFVITPGGEAKIEELANLLESGKAEAEARSATLGPDRTRLRRRDDKGSLLKL